jgi:protein TonB
MQEKKNKNINNDNIQTRSGYILSGLVIIIAFVICLMEYTKIDIAGASIDSSLTALDDEEIVEVNPNTPPPPPPPPPPPAPPEEVEVLEEEDEREETKVLAIDVEDTKNIVIEIEEEEEEEPVVEAVFDVVEENPEFQGGMAKMYEYLNKNIIYPEMAKENGIQGKVFVQFVVWKDGTIRDIKVVKGVHKTLDKEAKRVIKAMPKWKPGKQRGKKVNARFTLPIKFRIS